MNTPWQTIGNWSMGPYFQLGSSVKIITHNRPIQMPRNDWVSIRVGWKTHNIWVRIENIRRFIIFKHTNTNFTLSKTDYNLILPIIRPAEASNRWVLRELVAYRLLFTPIRTKFIDEDDLVALSDGKSEWIRREGHWANNIRFLSLY